MAVKGTLITLSNLATSFLDLPCDLEGRLRDGGIAVLIVSYSGVARTKDVVGKTTND